MFSGKSSLEYDYNQHIFQFAASRSKQKQLEYKYIGIDKDEGPLYCSSTKTFNVDAQYRNRDSNNKHNSTYFVSVDKILDEHIPAIHECILYEKEHWTSNFNDWFTSKCMVIAPRFDQTGYIVFNDNKYIDISWIAPKDKLLAYPGYENNVAVAGGKEIDQDTIFDDDMSFQYVRKKIWYIDSGNQYKIVSFPPKSQSAKLRDILAHQKKVKSVKVLQTALRKANTKLQAEKYGKRYYHAETVATFVWKDHLQKQLKKFDIKIEGNSWKPTWRMGRGVSKCVFDDTNIFIKTIDDPWYDTVEVVASNLTFSLNLRSGRFIIKGIQLKYVDGNPDGLSGMTRLKIDGHEDFHFVLFDIPRYAQFQILEYLSCEDLLIIKNVCQEMYGLCRNILDEIH